MIRKRRSKLPNAIASALSRLQPRPYLQLALETLHHARQSMRPFPAALLSLLLSTVHSAVTLAVRRERRKPSTQVTFSAMAQIDAVTNEVARGLRLLGNGGAPLLRAVGSELVWWLRPMGSMLHYKGFRAEEEDEEVEVPEVSEIEEEWPSIKEIPGLEFSQSQADSKNSNLKSPSNQVIEDGSDLSSLGELRFQDD